MVGDGKGKEDKARKIGEGGGEEGVDGAEAEGEGGGGGVEEGSLLSKGIQGGPPSVLEGQEGDDGDAENRRRGGDHRGGPFRWEARGGQGWPDGGGDGALGGGELTPKSSAEEKRREKS